ncbi:efflux RND transporter periplasmic adaptor subunit [Pedobacter sp. SD-b]|uniref:Efflux RND transporter periplasmic adaptor subunit n=1 Tax=Pedobacter segetis TaxID=2793069 RepID=A0ABS1BK35_9SPHI|nr:efflux RND transporter periplasmic adaptor subunit [Pedobacter segetis]MBK0383222.1 efflux RND transporter periplasmic adaptor subunit [Pedobacter segetis]
MKKVLMLALACAILIQIGCKPKTQAKEESTEYEVTSPLKIDTSFTKEYVSQIKSVRNIELRAQEKGYLQKIYVDEGQSVKAGQLLFKIMPNMYQNDLLKAEAEEKSAEVDLQNTKTLADKNIVSRNEQVMMQAKLDQAKAEVSSAKLHLSFTDIKAPFNGTVDRIPLKLGSLVDEGDLLTSLSDNSQVYAYFNVSEPEYLNYQQDVADRGSKKVSLILANNQPLKYKGDVETIEGQFDNETGNIAFRAKFPNPDKLLRNGESGKVQMTIPLKNALVIPQKATYEIQDKTYVFLVDSKGTVKSKQITIASELSDLYVVASGLSENDKILLEGVQKVKDDDQIKVKFVAPKKVINNLQLQAE